MVDKKFVKVLQGKEFVTHEGLLDEFHKQGGVEITSELVSSEKGVYIFKAIATMQIVNRDKSVITKKFTAHGDANEKNDRLSFICYFNGNGDGMAHFIISTGQPGGQYEVRR